jgi:tRNA nucleotidyltransferase (CCA-adding enzyme)
MDTNLFDINKNAVKILQILESHGFQAYIVGGAVRDIVLNKPPHDYDVCTDALPDDIKDIFGSLGYKTVLVGEKYGTVQVLLNGEGFEVTTFRIDNEYIDGRHPESVNFSQNLADDLKRRDFTINALACSVNANSEIKIIDFFGGQSDIENKIIRAVGNPCDRFSEDALRMMRAVRFSAQLGFEIEPDTKSAICELAANITFVSKERITVEIEKILLSNNPEKFFDLADLNLLKHIMPVHKEKQHDEKINKIKLLEKDFCVRFAALLEICSSDADVLKNLRLKSNDVKDITNIILAVRKIKNNDSVISKVFLKMILRDFGLRVAKSALYIAKIIYDIDVFDVMREIKENNEPYKLSDLKINGDDIIEITGEIPGKKVGEILSECLNHVIENPKNNTREYLINLVKDIL